MFVTDRADQVEFVEAGNIETVAGDRNPRFAIDRDDAASAGRRRAGGGGRTSDGERICRLTTDPRRRVRDECAAGVAVIGVGMDEAIGIAVAGQ